MNETLEILKTTVRAGLDRPVRLLHLTDTHLTLADERDDERKHALAARRVQAFGDAEVPLSRLLEYGRETCDLIVHTGDLYDFISQPALEHAACVLRDPGLLFVAGNHEYSRYVGEAWEDESYKMNSYMQIRGKLGRDLMFSSRVVGGVNVVCLDDSYYRVADWQTEKLKREVAKGLPVILAMHVPVFEESLYRDSLSRSRDCADIMGCDEEHLLPFSEFRALQQRPDDATRRFIDYMENEEKILAVIAGHVHYSFESVLPHGKTQYVTGPGYRSIAREITII